MPKWKWGKPQQKAKDDKKDINVKKPEPTKNAEKIEALKEDHQNAFEAARRLLHSEECKKFIDLYATTERKTINTLIELSRVEHDPVVFGQKARSLLSDIATIKTLIDMVHKQAGESYGYPRKKTT